MNELSLRNRWLLMGAITTLAIAGFFHFGQFADYTYMSGRHLDDIFRAKFWGFGCLLGATVIVYWKRKSPLAPYLAVFFLGLYFVVLYGILFRGTQYGMNSHWGDNGYRLAMVCKMWASGYFADPYLKDLGSLYPPLWFYATAMGAKLTGLEPWQTLKYGYLFLYLIYPWLLFYAWRPLVSSKTAAVIAITIIFVGHKYLDYIYYEHIAAALIVPWWLYFLEDAQGKCQNKKLNYKFLIKGSVVGGLIFLTYYPWFFPVLISIPIVIAFKLAQKEHWKSILQNLKRKIVLLSGVALVSSLYWGDLLWSSATIGFASSQSTWFSMSHADLTAHWNDSTLEVALMLLGVFFVGYLWNYWKNAHYGQLLIAGIVMLMFDRVLNIDQHSIQTRKLLEFSHVFAFIPLAIGATDVWQKMASRPDIRRGLIVAPIVLGIFFMNQQTEIYRNNRFKVGVNQRVPEAQLDVFRSVDYRDKVFLTDKYIETCYLPYYMFINSSNVSAHMAGRFLERQHFLGALSQVTEPNLLAYALAYNKYDQIDFVYLPYNSVEKSYFLKVNHVDFNSGFEFFEFWFKKTLLDDTTHFILRNKHGLYEISPPDRSLELELELQESYPALAVELAPPQSGSAFAEQYDKLPGYTNIDLPANHEFSGSISLSKVILECRRDSTNALILEFKPKAELKRDLKISMHCFPLSGGEMQNRDFSPSTPTTSWKIDELQTLRRELDLPPGEYNILLGFFRADQQLGEPISLRLTIKGDSHL